MGRDRIRGTVAKGLWAALLLCLPATVGLAASSAAQPGRTEQVYIWQRQWSPALSQAVRNMTADVDGWRVLAGQADGSADLRPFTPDWAALADSAKPVTAVVRLESRNGRWASPLDSPALPAQITQLLKTWRQHGLTPAGLEIDYDSPTARLAGYALFLQRLRPLLPPDLPLSITGLPDWLNSPDLDRLLEQTDDFTLQVHGLAPSQRGLFDQDAARAWTLHLIQRSPKPVRIALPTYGMALPTTGGIVFSPPDAVAALHAELAGDPSSRLAGFSWFRLPVSGDRYGWSRATLRAAIHRQPLTAHIVPRVLAADKPEIVTLALINSGGTDAPLPQTVALPAACRVFDGNNGYRRAPFTTPPTLHHPAPGLLPPGGQAVIGWARCPLLEKDVHLAP